MQFQNESKAPKLMCFEPLKASPLSLPLLTLNYNGHAVLYVQWFLPNNFSANYMKEDRTPPPSPGQLWASDAPPPLPGCLPSGLSRWPLPALAGPPVASSGLSKGTALWGF